VRGTFTIATLLFACSFDSQAPGTGSVGVGEGTEEGGTAEAAMSDGAADNDDGDPSGITGHDTKTSGDGTASGDDSDTNDDTNAEGDSTGGEELYGSCAAIKEAMPTATNGLFAIAPEGSSLATPFWVFCDMVTDGGGWTMVGRSVAGSQDPTSFGWSAARGDPADTTQPYSLNVKAAALRFAQVLVGNHTGTLAWGGNAYRFDVAPTFMAYEDDSVRVENLTTLLGDCSPSGGPDMLHYAGFTGESIFYLRDLSSWENYGLRHDGFDLYELYAEISPCSHAGRLHDDQGMIMVR
jgi:hypothetical protein